MTVADITHSNTCLTCEDLRRLYARNEVALRRARRLYLTALRADDAAAFPDLEEELKQTSAARKIIGYTIQRHQAKQHSQVPVLFAA